jgi:hypothetical protein
LLAIYSLILSSLTSRRLLLMLLLASRRLLSRQSMVLEWCVYYCLVDVSCDRDLGLPSLPVQGGS